ncbi:MAG: hypothetical protein H6678_00325 [Candidatus Delongbacteria bacterium]|nr:hypothetical protein [Candidatus Delongbacteria bacterium]
MRLWILLLFIMTSLCRAAILRVPADFADIQAAMDATTPGDTVHVACGIWTGLYTSPMHGMTLCSDYLFTQDSTDINETILDGEYEGTILDLYGEDTWFVLCGFTVQHGQGQDISPSAYNHRAGGIQKNGHVHGWIRDCVFRQNRAPRSAPVIYWGTVGSGISTWGDLIIESVACFENEVTNPTGGPSAAVFIWAYQAHLLKIDGLYYDGDGNNTIPLVMGNSEGDSVIVNNLTITNSTSPPSTTGLNTDVVGLNGQHYSNIRLLGGNGIPVCGLGIQPRGPDSSIVVMRNIQVSGVSGQRALYINSGLAQLDIDSLTVSNCRGNSYQAMVNIQSSTRGWLRNVHFHDNVSGDSVSLEPLPMLNTRYMDIDNLHFHDNRTIVPADPDPSTSGGNYILGAQVYAVGSRLHLSNMLFENNRLDDLDDYSDHSPVNAYYGNYGRELMGTGLDGLMGAQHPSPAQPPAQSRSGHLLGPGHRHESSWFRADTRFGSRVCTQTAYWSGMRMMVAFTSDPTPCGSAMSRSGM